MLPFAIVVLPFAIAHHGGGFGIANVVGMALA
jgi:hypothetical protein